MYVPRIGLAHMLESLNLIDLYTLFFLCSPNHLLSGVVALAFDESLIQRPS